MTAMTARAQLFIEDLGNDITLEMVYIPGGTFEMGSPEEGRGYEHPQHPVTIKPYFMGRYAITQEQWEAVANLPKIELELNPAPSFWVGRKKRPVEKVNWYEAVEFCGRLSERTGKAYRLPSEAEWEYGCRAGTQGPFHFGETLTAELANYRGSRGQYCDETTDVGSFPPNGFGLYDMHGNIREWCADPWHETYTGAPSDGRVWDDGEKTRVMRGGSYLNYIELCRSTSRFSVGAASSFVDCGFRVACS